MIELYTKNHCPFCVQAKMQLNKMDIPFKEINIETFPAAREFVIAEGHRTMPQIYRNGKLLVEGGAQELAKLSKDDINTALGNFDFDISMKL